MRYYILVITLWKTTRMKLSVDKDVGKHTLSFSAGGSLYSGQQFGESLRIYIWLDQQFSFEEFILRERIGQVYKDIYLKMFIIVLFTRVRSL